MNPTQPASGVSRFRPDGPVVMRPKWRDLLFLHWEFEPERVQRLLPDGLELDLFQGRAFVGLVPFTMSDVRPHFVPDIGKFGHFYTQFSELNVRTYVTRDGVPGVWFFSLDAASSLAVLTARSWFRLPYFKARMKMTHTRRGFDFWSKRLWPSPLPAMCRARFRPFGESKAAEPDSLDEFLIERYVLYSRRGTQLFRGRVFHEPYEVQQAKLFSLRETNLRAAGFSRPQGEPHVLFSRGVDVEVWGNRAMLKRATWPFDFVILVCCAFVFLTLGAMALYPGGTALNPHATTYHFFENFFSDLGRTLVRRNNRPNPFGSTLFFVALTSAGLALGVFFVAFARFFWNGLPQRVATAAGVAFGLMSAFNFEGIAFFRADLHPETHVHFVYTAFKTFPLAVFFFGAAMFLGDSYPRRGAWIFIAFFGILSAYLGLILVGPSPDSASGLMIQATGQKAVVYASLLCVGAQSLLARRHLSALARSNGSS